MLRLPGAPLGLEVKAIDHDSRHSRGEDGSQSRGSYSMGTECSARIASPAVSFGVGDEEETVVDAAIGRERWFGGVASSGWKRPSEVAFGAASAAEMEDDGDVEDHQDSELEGGGELELGTHHGSDMGDSVDSEEPQMGYPPPSPLHSVHSSCMIHWKTKPHDLAMPMLHDQIAMLGLDTSRHLHEAIGRGYFTLAEHLIDNGANLHIRDTTGRQPLHVACEANCKWLVQKLVVAGAGIIEKDKLHRTALECTSSAEVAMVLSEPLRWRRSMNRVYPWDFRRRVVVLVMSMESVYEEGSNNAVVPRHMDLVEMLVSGLAAAHDAANVHVCSNDNYRDEVQEQLSAQQQEEEDDVEEQEEGQEEAQEKREEQTDTKEAKEDREEQSIELCGFCEAEQEELGDLALNAEPSELEQEASELESDVEEPPELEQGYAEFSV